MQKQFLSDVSHELKTPMSAIIGSVEILQKEGIKNKDTFNEFMGILLKESYRMKNILDDILELSRLERLEATLNPSMVNIDYLVKETGLSLEECTNAYNIYIDLFKINN